MSAAAHRHAMTDDSGSVNVDLVLNHNTTYTSHMSVYTVPIADARIVSDNRVGLYHVVVANHGIIANDRKSSDKIALTQFGIRVDTRCFMYEFHKLAVDELEAFDYEEFKKNGFKVKKLGDYPLKLETRPE